MFTVSDAAKAELAKRLKAFDHQFVRLRMRDSCLLSLKLTLDESRQQGDKEFPMDGFRFLLSEGELHYFNGKTLDYVPDQTGFRQFEML
ncbi:Fe-S cluster assembly iron-binding protein IscA [Bhargavaea ginsengi]|uniref:Fe-S cluster assembly iron-binding protein IscA n=1 Tax=Bhargavaea ginsengi TaxID=426757 RepID=A0A1H6V588_9BACL|nr:iron-sulfur cluster biosynthesis family protein [Bhargavaea ginsengi]SEI95405.1 Fe-S cluster assembly iron-binding protein IscA [Bhargavaea ginsengi]